MTELKLAKLPARTPVKLTIVLTRDLLQALSAYAEIYRDTYGEGEAVAGLVPFMLDWLSR
jgi:hypothetical protein